MVNPEIIREFVSKIIIFKAEKVDGHRQQRIQIEYNCIGAVDLPNKHEKTAWPVNSTMLIFLGIINPYELLTNAHLVNGIASAGTVGKTIRKIPVLEKGPVDELLIGSEEKLNTYSKESINRDLQMLMALKDSGMIPIIKEIDRMKELYDEPVDIIFDKDTLYVR